MMKLKHYRRMKDVRPEALSIVFAEDDEEEDHEGDPPEIIVAGDPLR